MFEKTYKAEDIQSAHDKQRNLARGQGGIKFTPIEREILENHINLPEKVDE